MRMVSSALFFVASILCLAQGISGSTLYGYYFTNTSSGLVSINPQTGATQPVCDLSSLPLLRSGSSSSLTTSGTLLYYTIHKGNISIVELDPSTCKTTSTPITGLANGQDDVRDMKYDSVNNILYMVFPNPFCMHGSLDAINVETGAVISSLGNVVDPVGLSQTTGLNSEDGYYYYIGIPFEEADDAPLDVEYQLNRINLKNGNATTVTLPTNYLDIGNTWEANYTLNVINSQTPVLIGAVSPANNTIKQCYPSGFFSIDPSNGQITCAYGPVEYMVYSLAELDQSTQYFYQFFNDASNNFYLVTYDAQNQTVLYSVPCKMCSMISILAALP